MKITKSGHKKSDIDQLKNYKRKIMKKACNYMVCLRKQQKNL